jgi:hypothetical protein
MQVNSELLEHITHDLLDYTLINEGKLKLKNSVF